jgi:thiamine biosynthesis lipoprotein
MHAMYALRARSILVALLALGAACSPAPLERKTVTGFAQGTTYSLQWLGGASEPVVATAAELELARIDALLSNYRPDSDLERFNAQRSTSPVELPAELVGLLRLAKELHAASGGCFDPTVRPLVRAWGFDTDSPAVPSPDALAAARATVGFDRLMLDGPSRAHKAVPGLEIDMSSIGQGHAAERLAELLETLGSSSYLAEIGGEIVARGTRPDGSAWRVGVEDPSDENRPGATLTLSADRRTAVITSGTYRHFFEGDDRRYGHVIDPRTGGPIDHALLSVTVVGDEGSRTAAWATALLCLGPELALATAEREGLAAILWVADAAGNTIRHETRALTDGSAGATLD